VERSFPAVSPLHIQPGDKAIFMGDSWTFGQHIPDYKRGFAYQVIEAMQLDGQVIGYPGSGFLDANARNEGTYEQRLPGMPNEDVSLFVVQGGTNDRDQAFTTLPEVLRSFVAAAKVKYPNAQIVIMGPMTPSSPKDPRIGSVDRSLAGGAEEIGVHYIAPDWDRWIDDSNVKMYMDPSTGHPNTEGHTYIAGKVVEALTKMTQS
jgi:hypothetical protein